MTVKKKIPVKEFEAENVLKRMEQDRDRLVEMWGEAEFERRRKALETHVNNRRNKI